MSVTEASGRRTPVEALRLPKGTTALLLLLLAALVATSFVAYSVLYAAVPAKFEQFFAVVDACTERESILHQPVASSNDAFWHGEALQRRTRCVAPAHRDELFWIAMGTALLFGLATLLYALHPWWIAARRRLSRVEGPRWDGLRETVAELCGNVGVAMPTLMTSTDPAINGQVFGLPGRRRLRIDAGLATLHETAPARFRAIVLHELAHIRNRDVDITYLADAVWRSFVVVALLPVAAVAVHPRLFDTPLRWSAEAFSAARLAWIVLALGTLTLLVYLTRAALLRIQELRADVRATAWSHGRDPAPGEPPAEASASLDEPRWKAIWRDHPQPSERVKAIDSPDSVLLRRRLGEMLGVGVTVGVLAGGLQFVLSVTFPAVPDAAAAGAALAGLAGLTVPLGLAIWRAVLRHMPERPPARELLLPPAVLAAGVLVGTHLSLQSVQTSGAGLSLDRLALAGVLLVGTLVAARWLGSVAVAVEGAQQDRHPRAVPASIAALTLAMAAWFAAWFTGYDLPDLLRAYAPATAAPGWYGALERWIVLTYSPLDVLLITPLALLGLLVLAAVPVVLARYGRGHAVPLNLRPAVIAGLLGGVASAIACLALAGVVVATLPADRRVGEVFAVAGSVAPVVVAVLAQAVVGAVLAVVLRSRRALLIPLGVLSTGLLAAVLTEFGVVPLTRCMDLYANANRGCWPPYRLADVTAAADWMIVPGALAGLVGALLGAAIAGITRREPAPDRGTGDGAARAWSAPTAVVMLAAVVALVAAQTPATAQRWWEATRYGLDSASPFPSPALSSIDPCVVSSWTETHRETYLRLDGAEIRLTGRGASQRFSLDGTAVLDFGDRYVETGHSGGHTWSRITTGTIAYRYRNENGRIVVTDPVATGRTTLQRDGATQRTEPLRSELPPRRYTCRGDTLNQTTTTGTDDTGIDLRRTSRKTPDRPPVPSDPGCIVGTWEEIHNESYLVSRGEWVRFVTTGRRQRFGADGTGFYDDTAGTAQTTTVDGQLIAMTYTGTVTFDYTIQDGYLLYGNAVGEGTVTPAVNGKTMKGWKREPSPSFTSDRYTCEGETMTLLTRDSTIVLNRTAP